jgi:hypothetical protein
VSLARSSEARALSASERGVPLRRSFLVELANEGVVANGLLKSNLWLPYDNCVDC